MQQHVVIIGGTSGIGLAAAEILLREKFRVMANQVLELAALPPIESRSALRNGGDAPARRTSTRGTNARSSS